MALNLFEVVEYTGNKDNFAWRYKNPNVKRGTTVIVRANQLAFWVSNGLLVEVMGPGKHKLDGNYVQGLSWVVSQFNGGNVPSTGEIWFISTGNRSYQWGTPSRIGMNVAYPGFTRQAGLAANGNVQLRLNAKVDQASEKIWDFILQNYEQYGSMDEDNPTVSVNGMSEFAQERVQDVLAAALGEVCKAVRFGEYASYLPQIGQAVLAYVPPDKPSLRDQFAQWSMEVMSFQIAHLEADKESVAAFNNWLSHLNAAEAAKYEEQRMAEAKRYGIEQTGFGIAASRQAQGYTFQEERQFDVLQSGAGNAGVGGSFMSAGVGLAMGGAMGGVMGGMFAGAAQDAAESRQREGVNIPPPATDAVQPASGVFVGSQSSTPSADAQPTAPAQPAATEDAAPTKFCIHCGAKIPTQAKFCSECGGAQ